MNAIKFPTAKCVVVSGDIHGNFNHLVYKCCVQYKMRNTLLIVAGDCGFGFENRDYYENMAKRNSKRLSESNNWIVFVRGNHDNPAYFDGYTFKHRRMMAVPDYTILQVCSHTILCVGGGISIDRNFRKKKLLTEQMGQPIRTIGRLSKHYYWENEAPIYDDTYLKVINERFAVDTVVTHSAPSFCELQNKSFLLQYAETDTTLLQDIQAERSTMDALFNRLVDDAHPLINWFYGHFHQSWHTMLGEVKFTMLDEMEFQEVR